MSSVCEALKQCLGIWFLRDASEFKLDASEFKFGGPEFFTRCLVVFSSQNPIISIFARVKNLTMTKRIYSCLFAAFCVLALSAQTKEQENNAIRKLGIAQYAISHLYVDSVNMQKLTEGAITGMLSQLDPHSTYTDATQTKALNEPLRGDFEGIGVQFNMIEDTLVVVQPTDKGPSQKAGILAGDRIVRVNDTIIAGVKMQTNDIMKRLRGKKGTTVHLGIIRPGVKEEIKFDIVRDKIPLHTLDAAYMIDNKTGYIRFGSFGQKTPEEIRTAMKDLISKGMERLVIDLRGNGGGFMESSVQIANEFLQAGDMVVYTKGRAVPSQEYKARGGGMFTKGKVVVLIDEYSASAAEILAGALQDNDRAAIVGVRSFGKGLVQQPVQMPDGSMIRLTVSRYYTPAGRCIQKPYKPGEKEAYGLDELNRIRSGELFHADSIHHNDSLKCYTLKKHRPVYGGGGIIPDYFVPLDTMVYTKCYRSLSRKNLILPAGTKYIDQHRNQLKNDYPDFDTFKNKFVVPEEIIDGIFAAGEKDKITPKDDEEKTKTRALITKITKALVARDIWDTSQYFQIINDDDATIAKALQVIKK